MVELISLPDRLKDIWRATHHINLEASRPKIRYKIPPPTPFPTEASFYLFPLTECISTTLFFLSRRSSHFSFSFLFFSLYFLHSLCNSSYLVHQFVRSSYPYTDTDTSTQRCPTPIAPTLALPQAQVFTHDNRARLAIDSSLALLSTVTARAPLV